MGIYSTILITRDDARSAILSEVLKLSDEKLEDIMFNLFGSESLNNYKRLNNYRIVNEYDPEEKYSNYR